MTGIEPLQRAMHRGHAAGAAGVLVSGMVWLAAGIVYEAKDALMAFAVLFFGGMLIVPVAGVIEKLLTGGAKSEAGNPLARLGLEATVPLFAGLLVAWIILPSSQQLAFEVLVIIIGSRYFSFATIYGERLYYPLGAALFLLGTASALGWISFPPNIIVWAGVIEIAFTIALFMSFRANK